MRDEYLEVDGGRRLRVRAVGADDGTLVVYLHGSPSSRLDIDILDATSRARGVRLVAFDRPGYGGSDPAPFTFASIADDACAVADRFGAATFPVVGQSSGAAYALACAALRPDRVAAVVTGGGGTPFTPGSPSFDLLSPDEQRGVTLIGVDDVEAERLLAEADLPFMDALSLDDAELLGFWRDLCSPSDQEFLDHGFGPFLLASVRESGRPGQVGWARDNLVRMGSWPFDLGTVRCPAAVWHGVEDHPEAGERVVAWTPGARLHVVPDRGHFVLIQDWDLVLGDLLSQV